jgi:hypothetical protein
MMKISVLTLAVMFAFTSVNAQPIVAKGGVGIGALKLGMNKDKALSILKGEITWERFLDHKRSYEQYGAVDSVVQFVMGFDSVAQYANGFPESLPVFALYFEEEKVNFITVSSYGTDTALANRVVFDKGLKFYATTKSCLDALGNDYLLLKYGDYSGIYYFHKLGLELDFEDDRLVAVGIFPVMTDFNEMIRKKRAGLW